MEKLTLVNPRDREAAARGELAPEQVRTVTIDALVDTGATMLSLPADMVAQLGIDPAGTRRVRCADGRSTELPWIAGVWIELVGRATACNVLVQPVGAMALIGQIPLEELDLIVDPKNRSLSVNPLSPDMPLLDLFAATG